MKNIFEYRDALVDALRDAERKVSRNQEFRYIKRGTEPATYLGSNDMHTWFHVSARYAQTVIRKAVEGLPPENKK